MPLTRADTVCRRGIDPLKHVFDFEVVGRGQFPFDMLRYDRCWPARETEVSKFVQSEPRRIALTGLSAPTEARWESFGWMVQ